MTIRIGRTTLTTPLSIPFSKRAQGDASLSGPYSERGFQVRGREHGADAQATMGFLEREGLRQESMWVDDDDGNIPPGHYKLEDAGYEKPGGAPRKRTWQGLLVRKLRPCIVRQAEDDFVGTSSGIFFGPPIYPDAPLDEDYYVSQTATATETVILRGPQNRITDGAFAAIFAAWTNLGGNAGQVTQETTILHMPAITMWPGSAVRITADGSSATPGLKQAIASLGNAPHTVEAWAYALVGKARLELFNVTDAVSVATQDTTVLNAWQRLAITATLVTGKTYEVRVTQGVASSTVIFDDAAVFLQGAELILARTGPSVQTQERLNLPVGYWKLIARVTTNGDSNPVLLRWQILSPSGSVVVAGSQVTIPANAGKWIEVDVGSILNTRHLDNYYELTIQRGGANNAGVNIDRVRLVPA